MNRLCYGCITYLEIECEMVGVKKGPPTPPAGNGGGSPFPSPMLTVNEARMRGYFKQSRKEVRSGKT